MADQRIESLQVGRPSPLVDDRGRSVISGFVKQPVHGPVDLGQVNLDGDAQADLENHGGPDKAVCVYPIAHLPAWRDWLGRDDLAEGAFGENLSVSGVTERDIAIGDRYAVGDAVVEVSQPRAPCYKLARRWSTPDLPGEVTRTGRSGWYLRVVATGTIQVGQTLQLLARPEPELTISLVNRARFHALDDLDLAARLAGCELLADEWRETFAKRLR